MALFVALKRSISYALISSSSKILMVFGDTRVGTCVGETYQVTCAQTFHGYLLECVETVKLRRTAEHGVYKVGGTFLTVCCRFPTVLSNEERSTKASTSFGCMLQELAVVLCLDVHIILPLLAIYKVRGKQAERDLLQCAFGPWLC